VKISGLAAYVPPRVLTNADLEKLVATSDEWILQRTGIRERHMAEKGEGTSDLAKPAALEAIREAGLTPADIGFIVVGTTTPDTIFPSTACTLQAKIGAVNAWGFDLGAACSGFTYSMSVAYQMVATAITHAVITDVTKPAGSIPGACSPVSAGTVNCNVMTIPAPMATSAHASTMCSMPKTSTATVAATRK
jgi:3-oxoacyl-(acyl-carrier-protein) synthase III